VLKKNGRASALCRFLIIFSSISIQHHHRLINIVYLLLLEPGDPFALVAETISFEAHLPEVPFEKAGRTVVRNISLKGFLCWGL
jgi:hypothetical protein